MITQEERRFPDEQFYFEKGELVVDRSVLPEHVPNVHVLEGESIVGTYLNAEGDERTRCHKLLGWKHRFHPGEQLLRVETGTENVVTRSSTDGKYWVHSIGGEPKDRYEIKSGDQIVVMEGDSIDLTKTIFLPGNQPLPKKGFGSKVYEPIGVINPDGLLFSWGYDGMQAGSLVDLAIASHLMNSDIDRFLVDDQIRRSHGTLLGRLSCSELTVEYLEFFKREFDEDFIPKRNPEDRWDEFPMLLSEEQRKRYIKIGSTWLGQEQSQES